MWLHTKDASVYPFLHPVAFQKVVKRHSLNQAQKFLIDVIRGTQMCSSKDKTTSCTHLFGCSLEILFSRLSKTLMWLIKPLNLSFSSILFYLWSLLVRVSGCALHTIHVITKWSFKYLENQSGYILETPEQVERAVSENWLFSNLRKKAKWSLKKWEKNHLSLPCWIRKYSFLMWSHSSVCFWTNPDVYL